MWSDNELKLLLNIILEYKVSKTQEKASDTSCPHCGVRVNQICTTLFVQHYIITKLFQGNLHVEQAMR